MVVAFAVNELLRVARRNARTDLIENTEIKRSQAAHVPHFAVGNALFIDRQKLIRSEFEPLRKHRSRAVSGEIEISVIRQINRRCGIAFRRIVNPDCTAYTLRRL